MRPRGTRLFGCPRRQPKGTHVRSFEVTQAGFAAVRMWVGRIGHPAGRKAGGAATGSARESGLQLCAKGLEVAAAERPGEHLVDDGREVVQRANGGRRTCEGVVQDTPGGTDEEGVLHGEERDATVEEGPSQLAIGTSDVAEHAGRGAVQA